VFVTASHFQPIYGNAWSLPLEGIHSGRLQPNLIILGSVGVKTYKLKTCCSINYYCKKFYAVGPCRERKERGMNDREERERKRVRERLKQRLGESLAMRGE
jgi:hypothetical protein